MVISQITITNFRNYAAATFDLGQRTLILGTNGSGKSTILDAIAWCLTGRCRGINGKGEGQADLIRTGADLASVELTTDVLGTVKRSVLRDGGTASTHKKDVILNQLGVSEAMLLAAIYGGTFFRMGHAEAKSLLMQLLDVTVAGEDLPGLDLTGPVTLDALEQEFKVAYDNRAAGKRALAAVRLPDEPGPAPAAVDRARLEGILTDWQKATKDAGNLEGRLTAIDRQIDAAKKAAVSIPNLEAQVQAHGDMLAEATAKLETVKGKVGKALAEAMLAGEADVDGLANRARELNTLIDQITRHDAGRGCVLAAGITCHTPAAEFTDHVGTLRKEVAKLAKLVKAGAARADQMKTLAAEQTDAERQITYHRTQLDKVRGELAAAEASGHVETMQAAREDVQKGLDAANAEAERLGAELRQLQTERGAAEAHERLMAAYITAKQSHERLVADVAKQEQLVELLGPNGIRKQALASKLAEFEQLIGLAMSGFGFRMSFQMDPWRVQVSRKNSQGSWGQPVAYDLLSAGEQLWCALAFQVALAMVSGLNFAAVDAAEAVVDSRRISLTQAVMSAPVDQLLVAMARAGSEPNPDLDGLQVIRLG